MDSRRVDFFELQSITFEKPDPENFEGLALAYRAASQGGSLPTVFNAANEKAVALFLDRKIGYLQITDLIRGAMDAHKTVENPSVEEILEAEKSAYEWIEAHS